MNNRTREYLRGRFRDYYRRTDIAEPPELDDREWGFADWDDEEPLNRHLSIFELGDLNEYIAREAPRHSYMSVGKYGTPTATEVEEKEWMGSDLVFAITSESVAPDESEVDDDETLPTFEERLEMCHEELITLVRRLDELELDDMDIFFTGDGYRVQVSDDAYQQLTGAERAELLDYITAEGFTDKSLNTLLEDASDDADIAEHLATYTGGWQQRFYTEFVDFLHELEEMEGEAAKERLTEYNQIGDKTAERIYSNLSKHRAALESGQFESAGSNMSTVIRQFIESLVEDHRVALEGTMTANTHNFVRIPGTLNGDTGLCVVPAPREDLMEFDPLVRAVPQMFTDNEIAVDVTTPGTYTVSGEDFDLDEGEQTVSEALGVYLMTQGHAEKTAE